MTPELFRRILLAIWISGGKPDRRLREICGYDVREISTAFLNAVEEARAAGEITTEKASDGSPLLVSAGADGTLRDAIEPFLSAPDVSRSYKGFAKGALKFWLDLPGSLPEADLLAACERIPSREVYRLPEAIYARAMVARKTRLAPNWKSALRAAMERAAGQGSLRIAFPAEWAHLDDDVTARMISALATVWVGGREPSAAELRKAGGPNPASVQRRITDRVTGGRAALQPHEKVGTTLLWINLSRLDPDQATLADAVRPYLESDTHKERDKRNLRTALRAVFGDRYTSEEHLLSACSEIPCRVLAGWADRVQGELAGADPTSEQKKLARTYASSIRVALRWAARECRIPLFFSDRNDKWQMAKVEWIPTKRGNIGGASRGTRYCYRTAFGWLEEAIRDLYADPVDPMDVTEEIARAALDWHKERGRYDRANQLMAMLNWLARRGVGPYRDRANALESSPYLYGEDGDGCPTYESFLDALESNGLPSEWREFFEWYHDFSSLRWDDLSRAEAADGSRRFPERAPGRQIGAATLAARVQAVRWVLGITKNFLGVDLSTLKLNEAFSQRHLERVFARGREICQTKYELGELTSPVGSGLRGNVTSAGLVAEALYERRRHQDGHAVALNHNPRLKKGVDIIEEEGAHKSPVQDALWQGYTYSRKVAGNLSYEAIEFGDAAGTNTQKNIAEIIRLTPPDWYWDVHQVALRLAKRSLETDGESEEHHRLIRDVYVFGVLLSTGMRGHECAHVRLDLQYPEHRRKDRGTQGDRIIRLHRKDRKNTREHSVVIRDVFVPIWLEEAYLEQSRPWLMRNLESTAERFGLARNQAHQHLIVDNSGRALGSVEEGMDREGRDGRAVEARVSWLREAVKNRFGRIAWEHCGRKCPVQDGYFTLHSIRNVMAYYIYQSAKLAGDKHPATAAANYLGDNPSQVQDVYGGVDGQHIDSSVFAKMQTWGGAPTASHAAEGVSIAAVAEAPETRTLFEVLREARAEVLRECAEWGMGEAETADVWRDRMRQIKSDYERGQVVG